MRWPRLLGGSIGATAPVPAPGPAGAPARFGLDRARMFDLALTSRLAELVAAPPSPPDDAWRERFFDAAWNASIEVGSRAVFEGPDGFSYLRLQIPTPAKAFESNSLANLAAGAVEHATGAALFATPEATEPAFVFSMGLLDSLLRLDSWRGDPLDLAELARKPPVAADDGMETLTASKGRRVLVGAPSADYLPPATARALHHHLTAGWKMADPRVTLFVDPAMAPSRNLMLSRSFEEFPDPQHRTAQVRMLLWYLPPRRSILLRPAKTAVETMTPLSQLFSAPAS